MEKVLPKPGKHGSAKIYIIGCDENGKKCEMLIPTDQYQVLYN